ncbi:MAG: hypothetical protein FWC94_02840 [Bacteroidales bacterium]|nr:hypothetical protein [Bacteroidales bacterium]
MKKKEVKLQQKILDLIKIARTHKTSKNTISIGKITKFQADVFQKKFGINVREYERTIDTDGIRHALNRHPNLVDTDFLTILLIVDSPDIVGLGKENDTIVYRKDFEKYIFYVECIQKGRKRLVLKTLYKRKKPPRRT